MAFHAPDHSTSEGEAAEDQKFRVILGSVADPGLASVMQYALKKEEESGEVVHNHCNPSVRESDTWQAQ